tara:strand:- start:292 stop:1371 length:1080 start_codon:yes stop_codon:yes gene_type:complete
MKKNFQIFINIFFFTIFFLILINVFISISWKFYNNFKYSNKNPIPELVRSNYKLNDEQQAILHKNTHSMKYYYRAFVGPLPDDFESEFVNYNKKTGRKTVNKTNNCKKNVVFFGGSTTFGWLSTDEETIPSQFSKNLADDLSNYCVYNFGSPWFYSKQENNLLINLMDKKMIKPDFAIFIDGVNERCNGFIYEKHIRDQFDEIMVDHRTQIVKKKILPLVRSLPIYQLFDRIFLQKRHFQILNENHICTDLELKNLFQSRLEMRLKICENYGIQCLSFLQPFGGIHGNIYPTSKNLINQHKNKYKLFKEIPENLIINIADALDGDVNKYSYVDELHYSHDANNLISKKILTSIKLLNKL